MSLEYWFPLTSDLHNQGIASLANASVQSGCSLSSDGKLGGCYKNTGTANTVATPISFSADQFTLCAWVRIDARTNRWGRAIGLSGSGTYMGMVCENTNGQSVGFHYYKTINGTNTSIFDNYPCSPTVGAWYHYTMCYDGTRYYVYLNGNKIIDAVANKPNIRAEMTTLWLFGGTNNSYVKDSINDVRIYSHCLSALEIAEIAKGMILHYPLNGSGRGGANLARGTNTASIDTNRFGFSEAVGGSTRSIELINGIYCAKITRNTTTHSSWSYLWYSNWARSELKTNTTYTLSFDIIGSGSGTIGFSGFMNGNGTNNISASVSAIQNSFNADNWSHIVFRTTTISDFTDKGTGQTIYMSCPFLRGTETWIMMKNMHLEEGTKDTPWMPHSSDTAYITMGYDSTTEYDVSGYGHNGTKNGTIAYDSNTARYSVCSSFNGTSAYIESDPLPTETKTISCWLKTSWTSASSSYRLAVHDKNTGLAIGWSGTRLITYVGSSSGSTGSVLETGGIWTANTWHHVVIIKTGSITRDIYIDGVKMSPSGGNYWGGDLNKLNIGNRHISGSYSAYWDGQISDFRAYATALTEAQIKELYNTAVSIANNGTLMGYELVEV